MTVIPLARLDFGGRPHLATKSLIDISANDFRLFVRKSAPELLAKAIAFSYQRFTAATLWRWRNGGTGQFIRKPFVMNKLEPTNRISDGGPGEGTFCQRPVKVQVTCCQENMVISVHVV
jgi:hypothetical protein